MIATAKMVIERSEEGLTAYLPEMDGCVSYGENLHELEVNMREAIALHIKGLKEDGEEVPVVFKSVYLFHSHFTTTGS